MAAPSDSARQATNITTGATSANINVGSPSAGTLLIVFIRFTELATSITFSGYTVLGGPDTSDATNDTTVVYYRWADGTEGVDDPISWTTTSKLGAICWEVTGAEDPSIMPPQISTVAVGTTTANTANPNSVAPAGPPQDTLYLTMSGGDGELAYTGLPTNYSNLQAANSGTGGAVATNCFMGGASRQISESSSEDPGAFTHGAHSNGWTSFAVAIRAPQPSNPDLVTARVRT